MNDIKELIIKKSEFLHKLTDLEFEYNDYLSNAEIELADKLTEQTEQTIGYFTQTHIKTLFNEGEDEDDYTSI